LPSALEAARRRSDELFSLVAPAALIERAIPERHRLIFYLGHLEAFDWNLIGAGVLGLGPADPRRPAFDRLFAFGIDPVDGNLPADSPDDWPGTEEVNVWRLRARAALDSCLESGGVPALHVHAAIEHRLMHVETLTYLLRRLPVDRLRAPGPAGGPACGARGRSLRGRASIRAGVATLGMPGHPEEAFGWDNERSEHRVRVEPFAIDRANVTCGDWLAFMHAGGYADRALWSAGGWDWRESNGVVHPASWRHDGARWWLRRTFEEVPLPHDCPVVVSWAEASAYAAWIGGRLPTEAQFHRAAYGTPEGTERAFPWGDDAFTPERGNTGALRWDLSPVGSFPAGDSAFGVADLVGNGWEWTRTPFHPFEGFEPFRFYPGYSADFFGEDEPSAHRVLKGGGTRTCARLLRRSFRNWFQPHYPHVEATFRLVED
jgi:ergothioneine biosynthesis protein EgtB